jgi:hypothetical protein
MMRLEMQVSHFGLGSQSATELRLFALHETRRSVQRYGTSDSRARKRCQAVNTTSTINRHQRAIRHNGRVLPFPFASEKSHTTERRTETERKRVREIESMSATKTKKTSCDR